MFVKNKICNINVSGYYFVVGIITRQKAEDLLQGRALGSFLVRVSERVWGYAISYKGPERCKHFLIDTSESSYQFFGTNQIAHSKLGELVTYHKVGFKSFKHI